MSVPVLSFFNNKGGVGKTTLVYHLAWMFAELGKKVVAIDLDPQANLTSGFLNESELEKLWIDSSDDATTVFRAVEPLMEVGDLREPVLQSFSRNLHLIPGDVGLAGFEETLSEAWPQSMGDKSLYRPYRILSAFWQVGQLAASRVNADLVIADVGPNLGAINRSVLIGTDFIVIPLGADLYSLQGLKNLGPSLRSWRKLWKRRLSNWEEATFELPSGLMKPLGYVVQQHSVRLSRPVKAYDRWVRRMPDVYAEAVLQKPGKSLTTNKDPNC
jgi:chromosome partitioning protein